MQTLAKSELGIAIREKILLIAFQKKNQANNQENSVSNASSTPLEQLMKNSPSKQKVLSSNEQTGPPTTQLNAVLQKKYITLNKEVQRRKKQKMKYDQMISKLGELLPEYQNVFIKVIEKHQEIENNLHRLQVENKSYIKYKEKMKKDNDHMMRTSSKDRLQRLSKSKSNSRSPSQEPQRPVSAVMKNYISPIRNFDRLLGKTNVNDVNNKAYKTLELSYKNNQQQSQQKLNSSDLLHQKTAESTHSFNFKQKYSNRSMGAVNRKISYKTLNNNLRVPEENNLYYGSFMKTRNTESSLKDKFQTTTTTTLPQSLKILPSPHQNKEDEEIIGISRPIVIKYGSNANIQSTQQITKEGSLDSIRMKYSPYLQKPQLKVYPKQNQQLMDDLSFSWRQKKQIPEKSLLQLYDRKNFSLQQEKLRALSVPRGSIQQKPINLNVQLLNQQRYIQQQLFSQNTPARSSKSRLPNRYQQQQMLQQ